MKPGTGSTGWGRAILFWAALSAVIVGVVCIFQFGISGWPPWPELLRDLVLGFLVSFAITALASTSLPWIARRVREFHPVVRWITLLPIMAACGAAGLGIAVTALSLLRVLPGASVGVVFRENIVGVTVVTLLVGTVLHILSGTQERLEATELSVQTHRLERERAEKLASEARLASLASRVQPHFLFNTLNSISSLVREDPTQAERTIERLSALLRSSLNGEEIVPLEQELRLVTDYLEIQRTRLGERLRFTVAAAEDASGMVPPFAVQTLVENSIKHAGEKRPEGIVLDVRARREENALVVEVTDDGSGFDPDAIKAGHGLDTLAGRLRALYGNGSGMEFQRHEGAMTVRLRVPPR
jgi:LytS/YehU family sensor histidine kinase